MSKIKIYRTPYRISVINKEEAIRSALDEMKFSVKNVSKKDLDKLKKLLKKVNNNE